MRLLVLAALWAMWPGPSPALAAGALAACLAIGCIVSALSRGEPIRSDRLNHWFEAAVLLGVAGAVLAVLP